MKKTLITGANGFLGRAIISYFQKTKRPLHIWDRIQDGDILQKNERLRTLDSYEFDAVVHLAWNSISDTNYHLHPLNIEFAKATIDFRNEVISKDIKFVSIGSIYENFADQRGNLYQKAKKEISAHCAKDSYTKTIWISPTYVFSFPSLRPRVIRAISQEPNLEIQNPKHVSDWIEVRDVATAVEKSISSNLEGRVNLCSGIELSVETFVEKYKGISERFEDMENLDHKLHENKQIDFTQEKFIVSMRSSGITSQYLNQFFQGKNT